MNRSTGVVPAEVFKELIDAPHGSAVHTIRKYDPLYGVKEGKRVKWVVRCEETISGTAHVMASSAEEACQLAEKLASGEVNWLDGDGIVAISAEPKV